MGTKEEERKKKNDDLIRRMKAGESLALYNAKDTWYQPRTNIKKDKKVADALYKPKEDVTYEDIRVYLAPWDSMELISLLEMQKNSEAISMPQYKRTKDLLKLVQDRKKAK